jgi:hypothetical protein
MVMVSGVSDEKAKCAVSLREWDPSWESLLPGPPCFDSPEANLRPERPEQRQERQTSQSDQQGSNWLAEDDGDEDEARTLGPLQAVTCTTDVSMNNPAMRACPEFCVRGIA